MDISDRPAADPGVAATCSPLLQGRPLQLNLHGSRPWEPRPSPLHLSSPPGLHPQLPLPPLRSARLTRLFVNLSWKQLTAFSHSRLCICCFLLQERRFSLLHWLTQMRSHLLQEAFHDHSLTSPWPQVWVRSSLFWSLLTLMAHSEFGSRRAHLFYQNCVYLPTSQLDARSVVLPPGVPGKLSARCTAQLLKGRDS